MQLTRYDNQGKKSCWTHPATANQSLSILVHWVEAKIQRQCTLKGEGGRWLDVTVECMQWELKMADDIMGGGSDFLSQWHYLSNSRFNSSTVARNVHNIDIDIVHWCTNKAIPLTYTSYTKRSVITQERCHPQTSFFVKSRPWLSMHHLLRLIQNHPLCMLH